MKFCIGSNTGYWTHAHNIESPEWLPGKDCDACAADTTGHEFIVLGVNRETREISFTAIDHGRIRKDDMST